MLFQELTSLATYAFAIIAILVLVKKSVVIVPQTDEHVVERLGSFSKIIKGGMHFLIPVVDRIAHTQTTQECQINIPPIETISSDNAGITADAVVFYVVSDTHSASYKINNHENAITDLAISSLRAELGKLDLDNILSKRAEINQKVLDALAEKCLSWGIAIRSIEVKRVEPSRDLIEAMNKQLQAERTRRAEIIRAEGKKEAEIKEAEGFAQATVLKAEADFKEAQYQAQSRTALAEAEAKSTEILNESMEKSSKATDYFLAQKYIESLGNLATSDNSKVIMMPLETTATIGSIASVVDYLGANKS
ncbi:SPFH domain-containing protein [Vibrio barjaei]|uniref:SPFH domain-containing protein n=1 Tax=Vibrio barjaei TaxID=1676683 RepID=UPI0022835175|nr:SPFH domain-containing protein [Vibrio barjaei]MCY9872939.1 SPFH/Band 7/PHB domain protein [Vibrio barjaei]